MIKWIIENKEWFLQGLGITIILGVIKFIYWLLNKKTHNESRKIVVKGKNSTYIENNSGHINIKK